ncbi:hypothetical protein RJ641_026472 [Dillenia turbinata]|uniref:Uncharacterized protein n=1 Tax=Dillenia turbinata TaxID=194707 RepID=A0AAN8W4U5_9MAGN
MQQRCSPPIKPPKHSFRASNTRTSQDRESEKTNSKTMKSSLKFREEQKPLVRAKVPLDILGFPFQCGVVAGESKELSLNLSTLFSSGPSIKVAHRPNDAFNPFSLVVKTGTGPYGSPWQSHLLMSAEFNLLGRNGNQNPTFLLHFKPRLGDFSIKKKQSSSSVFVKNYSSSSPKNSVISDDDPSIEVVKSPIANNGFLKEDRVLDRFSALPLERHRDKLLAGVEVGARTVLPVRNGTVLSFRWGLRFPEEEPKGNPTAAISFNKIPLFVMNKIKIEHVAKDDSKEIVKVTPASGIGGGDADVAEGCLGVKRQLEVLQAENGSLKKAVEDLWLQFSGSKSNSDYGKFIEASQSKLDRRSNGGEKKSSSSSEFSGVGGKGKVGAVDEELKKALMGASATTRAPISGSVVDLIDLVVGHLKFIIFDRKLHTSLSIADHFTTLMTKMVVTESSDHHLHHQHMIHSDYPCPQLLDHRHYLYHRMRCSDEELSVQHFDQRPSAQVQYHLKPASYCHSEMVGFHSQAELEQP